MFVVLTMTRKMNKLITELMEATNTRKTEALSKAEPTHNKEGYWGC